MIKLIATDMDGTLLNDEKQIDNKFWNIHEKLTEKGIHFLIASGRQYYNIFEYVKHLKANIIILAENGSIIMEDGKELFSKCLPKEDAIKLIEVGRNIPTGHLIFCGKKKAYIENTDPEFITELEKYYKKYEIVEDITKVDDEALKITICDLTGAEKNTYPYYKDYYDKYKVAISGEIWVDVVDKDINKGVALEILQEKLGIKKAETMVFGDYLNDYELMQQGDYSFAMENAHPELKAIAKYSGGDNNDAGVVKTIEEYIFNKKI
ncbi:MAG: HAD family hydrolase [Fusobacterium sp. JB021]|nr:HAD family hydrolase [Fusobacterium sp. JB020]MDP0493935.1 HAD family hydrolase [Fusobacterium sp. JB021]MDP0505653.1 HAD family hydrolase [Fusobacterium sp. JB019]